MADISSGQSAEKETKGEKQSLAFADLGALTKDDFKNPQVQAVADRNSESSRYEKQGTIPRVEIAGDGGFLGLDVVGWRATPQDKAIFSSFDKLAEGARAPKLTDQQKLQIESLSPDQKQLYQTAITELTKLADGKSSPADYMTNMIKTAGRMAEANGREDGSWNILKPAPAELYRNYIGLIFSDKSHGIARDTVRDFAGTSMSIPGSALETVYQHLTSGKSNVGFNSNITDVNTTNSVTHHYRELLMMGYNRGQFLADNATEVLDSPKTNPGDVRNGYFSGMLGSALEDGKIKPSEAAAMTAWAYTAHGGSQPPWGAANKAGNFLKRSDYDIDKWLAAYRKGAN